MRDEGLLYTPLLSPSASVRSSVDGNISELNKESTFNKESTYHDGLRLLSVPPWLDRKNQKHVLLSETAGNGWVIKPH